MFFEPRIRGGISYMNKRYSEGSENINILYLGMNNLYGCAVSQYLPINYFKWVKDIDKIKIKIKSNSSIGYILEADLEYLKELHDTYNDYPLAPEKICIQKEWLSHYCLNIANERNITIGSVKKLVPNIKDKNNYVIRNRNWQQRLALGIRLKRNT